MSEQALASFSRVFHEALTTHDIGALAHHIDDKIDWVIYGPIDMFPFFGPQRGKKDVLAACQKISNIARITGFERERVICANDETSSLARYTLKMERTKQSVSVRVASFAKFRDGKLTQLRAMVDTFDLVEQMLGREINLPTLA